MTFKSSITFEVILHLMKNLHFNDISIHNFVYQNWLIKESARKKLAYFLEGAHFVAGESKFNNILDIDILVI